jgi:hypothetical protein
VKQLVPFLAKRLYYITSTTYQNRSRRQDKKGEHFRREVYNDVNAPRKAQHDTVLSDEYDFSQSKVTAKI